ncbi:MAG: NADAR family protein [Clostridia bacterium]|nr:NADAR family protein [Clostridia bacterium]
MVNETEKEAFEQLKVKNQTVNAVYFHKPEEDNGYLSNWYPATFVLDGQTFTSTEQYIMYSKCKLCGHEEHMAQIMNTDDPAVQQAIGQSKDMGYIFVDQAWRGMR